ncbi:MAG: tRNA uridine-5-carboxymethylaminomethyl(34) synthesis GTPase MnmE [Saccharofermentanales bacterium]|uniref:tRNA modification GTPase MnmE n=1 Tax=Desulfuromonas thiophila TaxID=57664 RepID=A0A1G7CK03_9BACT|nr:tRNA uridine-5-carboxymethylaminomethyl(34) synthesis GTPase MnmE [Desulfuromonas thiophila]SDE39698.1 tRNA modification GTPase trmE [Desulfuromonas thiophila]
MYNTADTIIAPATAIGNGGIAILRLSGPDSLYLLQLLFTPMRPDNAFCSHYLMYGVLRDGDSLVDRVMAVFMRSPNSFTREDVAEIHCHGNRHIVNRILDLFLSRGARLAHPGEFSYRSFLNGGMDLTRAEAVSGLIQARSHDGAVQAQLQLGGKLHALIEEGSERLVYMLALIEAYLDFPEDEVSPEHYKTLEEEGSAALSFFSRLADSYCYGRLLADGIKILILGPPNAGKSSLLNCLLGYERAIVSHVPGTTRDFIQDEFVLGPFAAQLIDTAGLRDTDDPVELIGIRVARGKIVESDLILFVVDGTSPFDCSLPADIPQGKPLLLINNKMDAPGFRDFQMSVPVVNFSAKTGEGLDRLKANMLDCLLPGGDLPDRESVVITQQRHYQSLKVVNAELSALLSALREGVEGEFLSCHLRQALQVLSELTGEVSNPDILSVVFSKFCIGK